MLTEKELNAIKEAANKFVTEPTGYGAATMVQGYEAGAIAQAISEREKAKDREKVLLYALKKISRTRLYKDCQEIAEQALSTYNNNLK